MSQACMNCGKPQTKAWEGVPVCDDCHKIATHVLTKAAHQMSLLLNVQKDVIRGRLVEGKLVLGHGQESEPTAGRVPPTMHEPDLSQGPGDGGRRELGSGRGHPPGDEEV